MDYGSFIEVESIKECALKGVIYTMEKETVESFSTLLNLCATVWINVQSSYNNGVSHPCNLKQSLTYLLLYTYKILPPQDDTVPWHALLKCVVRPVNAFVVSELEGS